jgi:hypothetical protein
MPDRSQYAATTGIPLIQSPSLRVPKQVTLPADIHPLPDSITAYFVYPYTLEPHVMNFEASRRANMDAQLATREACLRSREEEQQRRKREALRKIAPGFEPQAGVLVPMRTGASLPVATNRPTGDKPSTTTDVESVMVNVIDQLAALDASK